MTSSLGDVPIQKSPRSDLVYSGKPFKTFDQSSLCISSIPQQQVFTSGTSCFSLLCFGIPWLSFDERTTFFLLCFGIPWLSFDERTTFFLLCFGIPWLSFDERTTFFLLCFGIPWLSFDESLEILIRIDFRFQRHAVVWRAVLFFLNRYFLAFRDQTYFDRAVLFF